MGHAAESGAAEVAMGQSVGRDYPLDGVSVLIVEDHELVREVSAGSSWSLARR